MARQPNFTKVVTDQIRANGSKRMWRGAAGVAISIAGLTSDRLIAEPYQTVVSWGLVGIAGVSAILVIWGLFFPEKTPPAK